MLHKKKSILSSLLLLLTTVLMAEEIEDKSNKLDKVVKNMQVSAYFQGAYQYAQKDVYMLHVGAENEHYEKESFSRIGLRRAYVSTLYETGLVSGLITLEIRDRSIWFSDAFIKINDPWGKGFSALIGSMNTKFGYEFTVSPSQYELVEGTSFLRSLMDSYDIGAQFSYAAPKKYGYLNVNLSVVSGNGVHQAIDSRNDFVGSVSASTDQDQYIFIKGGFSYYNGSVYQGSENVFSMDGNHFKLSSNIDNIGRYAKREYFDVNAQLIINTPLGKSELRSEYIWGTQPATQYSSGCLSSDKLPSVDTYIRNFGGGYFYYLQQLGKNTPLTFFAGYSWYDPNTKITGNDIGLNNTTFADTNYQNVALGLIWYPEPSIRLQAFYDMPFNEKSINLADVGFDRHRKANIFTFKVQYKY